MPPVLRAVISEVRRRVPTRGILIGPRTGVSRVALVWRIVLSVAEVANRAASHYLKFTLKI